jgi:anti-sigma regulatory factor (Ser/Thr protein kinase)
VVREALDTALEDSALRQDARLIASELVTNAVRWSVAGPDQLIEVRASLSDRALRISVSDPCVSGQTAHLRAPADPANGGFGLRIVDRVATRWGSEHPNGQQVWAELAVSR